MNITVGLGCLVALAVLGGITGLSEQQFGIEDQGEILDMKSELLGNPSERRRGKSFCRRKLSGRCVRRRRRCPGHLSAQTSPGSPYCGKFHRCCHPGCEFGGKIYPNGAMIQGTCMKFKCIGGRIWKYTGDINQECNSCTARGDPHMYMFDEHCVFPPCGHKYDLTGQGDYVITQDSISLLDSATFGVESHLQECNVDGMRMTCVQNITYYEPGINVTLTSQDLDVDTTEYCSLTSVDPITDPRCAIKVFVNGEERIIGRSVHSFYATDGTVLVFNHPNIVSDLNRNCVNIVGSKGLSVSLCIRNGEDVEHTYGDFTWLDVSAMPSLESTPSILYGLCDTNTGATRNNYTMSGGNVTDDVNTFTQSWMV